MPGQPTQTLLPYVSTTQTPTSTPAPVTLAPLATSAASPTPRVHVVKPNETMSGIAAQYGIGLEDLLTANPGSDPRFLSVGHELIIPGPEGPEAGIILPTVTPWPIPLAPVSCYEAVFGKLWCITTAKNDTSEPLEGLSILITIYDQEGQAIASKDAFAPLDLLPSKAVMPLMAFFSIPEESAFLKAKTNLASAFHVSQIDDRYPSVEISQIEAKAGENHDSWHWQGKVSLIDNGQSENAHVSLLVVALDAKGEAIGFRKTDSAEPLQPGEAIRFDVTVYSLGPTIETIEVLAEAIPIP